MSTTFENSTLLESVPAFSSTDKSRLNESFDIAGELDHASISIYFSTAAARLDSFVPSNDGFNAFATSFDGFVVMKRYAF